MGSEPLPGEKLWAVSDLHVGYSENRQIVAGIRPGTDEDWLIIAGDVSERVDEIEWVLRTLRSRFSVVIWTPGNHELWTSRRDRLQLRGVRRYQHLVELCGQLGVTTPEDEYPVWLGRGGPATVAPLFLLYDYTFRPPGTADNAEALAYAYQTGVVCVDEDLLHPDPYPTREAWCEARLAATERRLDATDPGLPTVLVNHYPLVRQPTDVLRHPQFAQWCGTRRTADWPVRYRATAVVYGHLHIPRTTWHDGVRHEEVSLGYPREWRRRNGPVAPVREILPGPGR
jgi:3',5'-cyclic AMP phosphodiesterase CpdA